MIPLKECSRLNDEYDECCRDYYNRRWENCPKCDVPPMLGTHLRAVGTDAVQILTLTCKCGTYPFQTKRMMKLADYWNAHCFSLKTDIKG